MRTMIVALLSAFLAFAALPAAAQTTGDAWVLVGEKRIGRGVNSTTLELPNKAFTKIRISLKNESIVLYDMRMEFSNDTFEDIDLRREARAGGSDVVIDLQNVRRPIRKIELRHSTPQGRGVATMSVHAEDDELRRILASYEAVATERVGSGSTVTIPVGLREGRMTEIRLRALRGDIFIRRVEIEFGNGERQQVRMRDRIEAGSVSDAVDLAGESRFIRNVVVTLSDRRTDDNARVQLLAKIDRSRPPRESNTSAPKGWVLIGKHTVTRGEERDVVTVGASAGRFARLGLRVLERDIYLDQIVVTYGSGRAETIRVRRRIEGSNQPVAIELDGERFIRQIELTYEREGRGRGPAIVEIYGEHSASWLRERDRGPDRGGRGDGWTLLGAQRAPLLKNDWDTFNVGTRKGRFKAIGLRALEQTIRVEAIRVTYANGETEDLTFSGTIDAGQATPPFDLRGRAQTIDRILVKHRTRFNFKGEGTLEIWGLR